MTLQDLARLVADVRKVQIEYRHKGGVDVLAQVVRLEHELDAVVAEILAPQPTLFGRADVTPEDKPPWEE